MLRISAVAVFAFILSGCAGTVGFVVPESEKDPAFSFDDAYNIEVDHPGGRQQLGQGWITKCGARKFTARMNITNSKATWHRNDGDAEGFVDSNGKFRIEKLLDAEVSGTSVLSDGSVTVILQGDVSEGVMKGLLVYGVAQFNNRGCSYPVSYSKP